MMNLSSTLFLKRGMYKKGNLNVTQLIWCGCKHSNWSTSSLFSVQWAVQYSVEPKWNLYYICVLYKRPTGPLLYYYPVFPLWSCTTWSYLPSSILLGHAVWCWSSSVSALCPLHICLLCISPFLFRDGSVAIDCTNENPPSATVSTGRSVSSFMWLSECS